MGFQPADVVAFARDILSHNAVTGVWLLQGSDYRSVAMYIAVKGLDDEGYRQRFEVRELVEAFIDEHQAVMQVSDFLFDYHVFIDEPDLGPLQIPEAAVPVAA
jgi:hypothetical protein